MCAATIFLLLFASCSQHVPPNEQATSSEIVVAAAANLTDVFTEFSQRFTKQTGVRVRLSFGATADLAKQIENGAPFDLFAAADTEHVDALDRMKLIAPDTKALYARGRLVLWIPPGHENIAASLTRVEDVTRNEVARIAIAKPDVAPYGRAAIEALQALNVWQKIEPKVVYGQNVAQVKQFAATGNADAAFIPLSLVVKEREGKFIEVEARLHQPIDQALGVMQTSGNQATARAFANFILSAEGQTLMKDYGYDTVPREK